VGWTAQQWQDVRSEGEKERVEGLRTEVERDVFRILLNSWVKRRTVFAKDDDARWQVPVPIPHSALRIESPASPSAALRPHFCLVDLCFCLAEHDDHRLRAIELRIAFANR
jgi:hypothetical protein